MTVRELIEQLKQHDPERVVILSSDGEGNSHAPLAQIDVGAFRDGEFGLDRLTEDDRAAGYTEEDVLTGGVPAVALYP